MKPYYEDASVTIYNADCRDVLPTLDEVDLVLTDPPYGINLNNDWQNKVHENNNSAVNHASGGMQNDEGALDFVALLSGYDSRIVFGFPYLTDPEATGWVVWDKEPGFKGRSLTSPVEMAYSTVWKGFKAYRLLWSGYMRAAGSEPRSEHPTQKPVSLMRWCLEFVPDAQTILDPFMGSGTTLRAAKDLNRKAIGIELEERYCEIAAKRMAQLAMEL